MHDRIERDLEYLTTMANEIKAYLLSDELYWHTSGTSNEVTLGGMLVRLRRLYAVHNQLGEGQHSAYHSTKATLENALDKWLVQAEDKAKREIKIRLNEWERSVEELENNLDAYASNWPNAAYSRSALRLLIGLKEDLLRDTQMELLASSDRRVRKLLKPHSFLWGEQFADGFPVDDFWWLYASPNEELA